MDSLKGDDQIPRNYSRKKNSRWNTHLPRTCYRGPLRNGTISNVGVWVPLKSGFRWIFQDCIHTNIAKWIFFNLRYAIMPTKNANMWRVHMWQGIFCLSGRREKPMTVERCRRLWRKNFDWLPFLFPSFRVGGRPFVYVCPHWNTQLEQKRHLFEKLSERMALYWQRLHCVLCRYSCYEFTSGDNFFFWK